MRNSWDINGDGLGYTTDYIQFGCVYKWGTRKISENCQFKLLRHDDKQVDLREPDKPI